VRPSSELPAPHRHPTFDLGKVFWIQGQAYESAWRLRFHSCLEGRCLAVSSSAAVALHIELPLVRHPLRRRRGAAGLAQAMSKPIGEKARNRPQPECSRMVFSISPDPFRYRTPVLRVSCQSVQLGPQSGSLTFHQKTNRGVAVGAPFHGPTTRANWAPSEFQLFGLMRVNRRCLRSPGHERSLEQEGGQLHKSCRYRTCG